MVEEENKEIAKSEIIEVEYEYPKFWHRVLANFTDILIMTFVTILLFIGSRAIVQSTSMYQSNDIAYKTKEVESSLFVNTSTTRPDVIYRFGDEVQVITTYLPKQDTLTYKDICRRSDKAIKNFIEYLKTKSDLASSSASTDFDNKRLALSGAVEGHEHYFVKKSEYDIDNEKYLAFSDDDEIIIPLNKSEIPYYPFKTYFDNFYRLFIDDDLIDNYLVKYFPEISAGIKNEGRYVLFIEFPAAYLTAAILVYYVPTLFFRRGRMTLGKALYHIGLVDQRYFSPSIPRSLARFAIFLFAELILSIVTFGIPFFISFTMMLVTKRKQGFPDYLLGLTEIDASKQKIYFDKVDILSDKMKTNKEAPDFKLPDF